VTLFDASRIIQLFHFKGDIMKKLAMILALALASTAALAQSQITVYGRMNAFVVDQTTGGVDAGTTMSSESSRIGFRAVENLGGGLQARATIETSVSNASPDTASDTKLGNRTSLVGLATKQYSVDVGRDYHSHFWLVRSVDPFWGRTIGSASQDVHDFRNKRLSNTVFVRAEPIKGIKLALDRQLTNNTTGAGLPEAMSGSVTAELGRITVGAARFEQGANSSNALIGRVQVGTGYVGVSYTDDVTVAASVRTEVRGTLLSTEQLIPGTRVTAKASLGRTDAGMNSYAVGADYGFSKNVIGRVMYRNADHDVNTRDVRQVVAGLEYKF
jgi:predicted porin